MKKAAKNYMVFVILLILGTIEAVSGFVLWVSLPKGGWQGGKFSAGIESTFWTLSRHTWLDIHNWVATIIVTTVIIHLALQWRWIIYTTKRAFQVKKQPVQNLAC
jgi:hypothetical protein